MFNKFWNRLSNSHKDKEDINDLKREMDKLNELHGELFEYYTKFRAEQNRYLFSNTIIG